MGKAPRKQLAARIAKCPPAARGWKKRTEEGSTSPIQNPIPQGPIQDSTSDNRDHGKANLDNTTVLLI